VGDADAGAGAVPALAARAAGVPAGSAVVSPDEWPDGEPAGDAPGVADDDATMPVAAVADEGAPDLAVAAPSPVPLA